MKNKKVLYIFVALMIALLSFGLSSCGSKSEAKAAETVEAEAVEIVETDTVETTEDDASEGSSAEEEQGNSAEESETADTEESSAAVPDGFTERDFDIGYSDYETIDLGTISEDTYSITQAGTYLLTGEYEGQIVVDVPGQDDKVQIVLDGATITNESSAAIYVLSADKVFFTTTQGSINKIATTGTFVQVDENEVDGAIFSKDDIVFNGEGTLEISCLEGHGIVSKDDLKITGGTYVIESGAKGLTANDLLGIAGGNISITSGDDGINCDLDTHIIDGDINVEAGGDGIHSDAVLTVDGGNIIITASEGLEGTVVRVNDGDIDVNAWDDGINAAQKVTDYDPTVEINGGNISVNMGAGDTDAIDSNGYLYINGGIVNINAQSPFDYDWGGAITGGEVYVNGTQITDLYNSMMGGGMGGFPGGGKGGFGGGPGGRP